MEAKKLTKSVHASTKHGSARHQLPPLMFEMGRLMKSCITSTDVPVQSFLHMETLRYIMEHGSPTMREVASYLKVAPPTATALIQSFVGEGILDRVNDLEDRRRVRLTLSKKGQRIMEQIKKQREEAFSRIFASLSEADCKELVRILTIITRS